MFNRLIGCSSQLVVLLGGLLLIIIPEAVIPTSQNNEFQLYWCVRQIANASVRLVE